MNTVSVLLNTGGTRLRVLPLVGYTLHSDPAILATQRRMASSVVYGPNT